MKFIFFTFVIFLSALKSIPVHARPQESLVLNPRSIGMGGAGVGLADDEAALFMNPAGLAGQDARRFRILGVGFEASTDSISSLAGSVSTLRSFSISSLNTFMGKNIHLRGGNVTVIRMKQFAFAYLVDGQAGLNQFNQANPTFDLRYQTTHGMQFGYGHSFKKGKKSDHEFRIGGAGKVLWRRGGEYRLSTAGFLQAVSGGTSYLNNLVGPYGMGVGFDLGTQAVYFSDPTTEWSAGASVTDIGGTQFSKSNASPIASELNVGFGFKKKLPVLRWAAGLDFKNLTTSDFVFTNKIHIGTEIGLPFVKYYMGMNRMNLTYGAILDLWLTRVTLLTYGEENGVSWRQNPTRRFLFQVDVQLPI